MRFLIRRPQMLAAGRTQQGVIAEVGAASAFGRGLSRDTSLAFAVVSTGKGFRREPPAGDA